MSQKHTYELDYFPIPKGRAERFVAFLFLWLARLTRSACVECA